MNIKTLLLLLIVIVAINAAMAQMALSCRNKFSELKNDLASLERACAPSTKYFIAEPAESCNDFCRKSGMECVEQRGFPRDGNTGEIFRRLGFPCASGQAYYFTDNPCIRTSNNHCYGLTDVPETIDCADGHNFDVRRLCPCA